MRLLFSTSLDAILITLPTGEILEANPSAEQKFGRSEAELRQLGRAGVVDLNDPRLPLALAERRRTGYFKGELNFLHRDGTVFPTELVSTIFTDSNGEERTSMFIRDISKRKQAEELLTKERELFQTTLNEVGVAIIVTDPAGKIELMNPLAEEYSNWKKEDASGKDFDDVFKILDHKTGNRLPGPVKEIQGAKSSSESPYDAVLVLEDGTERFITGNANSVSSTDGSVSQIVISIKDITKEYSLEREIEGFLNVNLDMLNVGDLNGNFVKVNHKFEEVLGYTSQELEGKNFMEFIHPEDVQPTLDALASLGANENLTGFVNRYR